MCVRARAQTRACVCVYYVKDLRRDRLVANVCTSGDELIARTSARADTRPVKCQATRARAHRKLISRRQRKWSTLENAQAVREPVDAVQTSDSDIRLGEKRHLPAINYYYFFRNASPRAARRAPDFPDTDFIPRLFPHLLLLIVAGVNILFLFPTFISTVITTVSSIFRSPFLHQHERINLIRDRSRNIHPRISLPCSHVATKITGNCPGLLFRVTSAIKCR